MSQEKKLFVVPMLLSVSAVSDGDLYEQVVKAQSILLKAGIGLVQDEAIEPKVIDVDAELTSLRDVMTDKELVGHNPRVVIQLDDDGGSPEVMATTEVDVAVLRQGKDLKDYDAEDIFQAPDPIVDGRAKEVVGSVGAADVHPVWVNRVFNTIKERGDRG